ncbi:MAG TPA: metallopeptidase family protein [Kofleriaceae bacterium]|nr:metallopeptidase family protein [Kofleriaceae bacterium]
MRVDRLDELAEEVRITVLHETAHYFGLDEEDLERIGLDCDQCGRRATHGSSWM